MNVAKMPKGAVIPFYYETYQCQCGWKKLGDKRSVNLAIKLHNKHTHTGQEVVMNTWTELERPTKSDSKNKVFKAEIKPVPAGLTL